MTHARHGRAEEITREAYLRSSSRSESPCSTGGEVMRNLVKQFSDYVIDRFGDRVADRLAERYGDELADFFESVTSVFTPFSAFTPPKPEELRD